ncbi:discoidin domain-containing protein [Sphingobium sp. AP49]|uniref:discoidin domain-containing protein n=1 Tax=Sphingobium sp. AP49 TaxID=1144307 RepID=UPI00026ED96F|nr:discoidin domain-containing protein [Sphingobium sp. AP49]WHO37882.1 discoidin domain-containing protein [Sphingobium sp. AP49]
MSNAVIVKPLAFAAASAGSTAAGYDPAFVGNDHMGVVWKSATGAASQALTIDMGANVTIDTILLLGCTGALAGWTLKVEAATSAQGATFPAGSWVGAALPFLAGSAMPVSGRGRAIWFAPASPPPASRYWRLTIGGLANAAATVARLVMGRKIQLQRNFQFGAAFGVRDMSNVDFSVRGVLLRRRGVKLRSVAVTFGSVYKDEVEAVVHPLIEEIGISEPIALIIDPDDDAQRQNRIWFGPLVGDLGTVWAKPGGFEWRASLVGLNA